MRAVNKSVEQIVEDYRRASEAFRRKVQQDPAEARAFLIRAGVLKPDKSAAPMDREGSSPPRE